MDETMFTISHDEKLLVFTLERGKVQFGEGTRVLFWIDKEQMVLQRGRQEAIPIALIDGFGAEEGRLFCRLGETDIALYEDAMIDAERLREAAGKLAGFCGVAVV
jgi:hypothetical protein